MSKNLVLLSDGTGQRGGVGFETNIWRLYKALSANDQNQLICYDDGVGSQKSRWSKIIGGMAAFGLAQNVRELYSFLVRHWQPADRIYLFGFSRGAFTVRVLSDMISRCGIVRIQDVPSEKRLTKLVKVAYTACLKSYYRPEYARAFRKQFSWKGEAEIQFIGVWDTVGAIGLPFKQARFAMHNMLEYGFRGSALNSDVLQASHAMSIDDSRATFHPVVWDERIDTNPDRISQVWFSGAHSNIGGGYPKNQLSLVTLDWMIDQVKRTEVNAGLPPNKCLLFENDEVNSISREKNAHGRIYNSRSGPAAAFRFLPRCMEEIRQSYTEQGAVVHPAVFNRIEQNTDGYSPHNLTEQFLMGSQHGHDLSKFPNEWRECMEAAKSYNYLQQVLYHIFILPIFFMVLLCIWKAIIPIINLIPFITVELQGWFGPYVDIKDFFVYAGSSLLVFGLSLVISEKCQFPLRNRQERIASQGWSRYFQKCRVDDRNLLAHAKSSLAIQVSKFLKRNNFLQFYNGLVTLIIYLFVYTWGLIYLIYNRFVIQRPRLKEIRTPGAGLIDPVAGKVEELFFETSMYRMYTGLYLQKDKQYRISVDKASEWFDARFEATPDGLNPAVLPSCMKIARKFSRMADEEIFTLLGEIDGGQPFRIGYGTTCNCEQGGELVLYVNDVSFWPFRDILYLNNKGAARVHVECVLC